MSRLVGTFPKRTEFDKAQAGLDSLRLPYEVISPEPTFTKVGVSTLVLDKQVHLALYQRLPNGFTCSGWVDHRPADIVVPDEAPPEYEEDTWGETAVMVLAPCVADAARVRLIAHISGDMSELFPYLNAEMHEACYNHKGPTFTFMMDYRMICLYPRRIALAKADEIVDAWRVLEVIRCRVNDTWARRAEISPSYEMREKPPALEIFKRLPRTNCRACGDQTCLAFALRLWGGGGRPSQCKPVFEGDHGHLRPALLEICRGLGVIDDSESLYDTTFDNPGARP